MKWAFTIIWFHKSNAPQWVHLVPFCTLSVLQISGEEKKNRPSQKCFALRVRDALPCMFACTQVHVRVHIAHVHGVSPFWGFRIWSPYAWRLFELTWTKCNSSSSSLGGVIAVVGIRGCCLSAPTDTRAQEHGKTNAQHCMTQPDMNRKWWEGPGIRWIEISVSVCPWPLE